MNAVCIYCGCEAEHRDHFVPVSYSHNCRNFRYSETVPSCALCNTLASNYVFKTLQDKAAHLLARYRARYKRLLKQPSWTAADINQLKGRLKAHVIKQKLNKSIILFKINNLEYLVDSGPSTGMKIEEKLDSGAYKSGNGHPATALCCTNGLIAQQTRFTLVHKHPFGEQEHKFFTLAGLDQWLDNARATGEVGEMDKVAIYDDSGVKL